MPLTGTNCNDGYSRCTADTDISFDRWVHVAGVYNGSSVTLYLDGVTHGTYAVTVTLRTGSSAPTIAAATATPSTA